MKISKSQLMAFAKQQKDKQAKEDITLFIRAISFFERDDISIHDIRILSENFIAESGIATIRKNEVSEVFKKVLTQVWEYFNESTVRISIPIRNMLLSVEIPCEMSKEDADRICTIINAYSIDGREHGANR